MSSELGDGTGSTSGSGVDRTQGSPKRHGVSHGSAPKGKMNYACEACRLAKVKCHPGSAESGVCKRYVLFHHIVISFVEG